MAILQHIFDGITLILIFVIGAIWGLAVIPAMVAVICAVFYADAFRDGM